MNFAHGSASITHSAIGNFFSFMKAADSDSKPHPKPSDSEITLELIISVGVLGWLAIGMVLMGLGIW
jgi:hypothetical protein